MTVTDKAFIMLDSIDILSEQKFMWERRTIISQKMKQYARLARVGLHIGEGFDDYGTTGYFNDTMPTSDESKPANSLKAAVRWINAHKEEKNIKNR